MKITDLVSRHGHSERAPRTAPTRAAAPAEPLRAVAYASTAARNLSAADLEALVAESHRIDAAAGITGVLLYCDGNFMHYLEGPAAAVAAAYARLRASCHHHQVNELLDQPIARREFSGLTAGGCGDAGGIDPFAQDDLAAAPGPGRILLRSFWRNCRTCSGPEA
jgi:hypothetical protein